MDEETSSEPRDSPQHQLGSFALGAPLLRPVPSDRELMFAYALMRGVKAINKSTMDAYAKRDAIAALCDELFPDA